MKSDSLPNSSAKTSERSSARLFFIAFFTVIVAGLAKVTLVDKFGLPSVDSD